METDSATQEVIFGVVVLLVAAPFIWWAGILLSKVKNAKFTRAWQPLVPLIENSTIRGDGGGASTSWLSGRYDGREVVASMSPDIRGTHSQYLENRFAIELPGLPGRSDWSVEWKDRILGFGQTGWKIDTDDEELERRLVSAGVFDIVGRLGRTDVRYRKQYHTLTLNEDVRPMWVPGPERFRLQLDTMNELAAVNAVANCHPSAE